MMKCMVAVCALAFVCGGAVHAQEKKEPTKIDEKKLVGKWELTKSGDANAPKGAVIEMMKDGKLMIVAEFNGKKIEINGTYAVKGDQLTVILKGPDGTEEKETDTIKALTDDKLVTVDNKGKETEFAKKK